MKPSLSFATSVDAPAFITLLINDATNSGLDSYIIKIEARDRSEAA